MRRKEESVYFGYPSEGITVTVTRVGVEVRGLYDSFVGLEGGTLTWEVLDEMRRKVNENNNRS